MLRVDGDALGYRLDAMRDAHIRGALVGVESITPEGLLDTFKDFNLAGDALIDRLRTFRRHGVYVLGSFIFGLPSGRPATFEATADLAQRAELPFAQFVMLTPFPGTVDFERWQQRLECKVPHVDGVPVTQYWLIPPAVAAEGLHVASDHVARGDSCADPADLGIGFTACV